MTDILSGDVTVPGQEIRETEPVDPGLMGEVRAAAGSPVGVRLIPDYHPGLAAAELPPVYQDIVEVLADAVHPMRAHHLRAALGLSTDKSKVEGFRSNVERGWLTEAEPGLFAAPAAANAPEQDQPTAVPGHAGVDSGPRP
ncbi:hypothetical protein [Streptomyces sp. NPDC046939]|uniref:hypothetical protein n=1 Tax=Streptomyces sp. NPDC046939 TaxID=3155376 RepID=UPI003410BA66